MITIEELNNIEIGDQIKIIDKWGENSNAVIDMDYLLGRVFPITANSTRGKRRCLQIWEGTHSWLINENDIDYVIKKHEIKQDFDIITDDKLSIEKVIKCTGKSIADASLEKMLEVSI